jgi:predicted AlkP superfamily phosphohydrolase/phosphomutase
VPARTLFVGLDAADPFLLRRWAEEDALPRFAALSRDAAEFALANPLAVVGGGVWQDLATGRSCGRTGIFFPARQLHTGESSMRPVERAEVDPRAFWTAASDAGKRVAVVDVPHSVAPPALNGVFVAEWGTHDRLFGEESNPPGLLAELRDRHGEYPLWKRPWPRPTTAVCDGHDGSLEQYEQLLDDLLAGIEQKTRLLLDVLDREEWDLFACAFSEGQCSGHQLFHFLQHGAPRGHDRLAKGIKTVYERLDASLGALVDAAGREASVLVVASHAFTPLTGGTQLVPEVLVRLGYGSGSGASARARSRMPAPVRKAIRAILPRKARESVQARVGTLPSPLGSPQTRAAALDGDRCSWIRLNLVGREPHGSVQPGGEAEEILSDIRAALLELEHPESGERIVTQVQSGEEAFGPEHHPDVPDLIVSFRDDLGRLEACRSTRVGVVRAPYRTAAQRTGAHPPVPSYLWIGGPSVPDPAPSGSGRAVDLAPTVLSVLGVPPPAWLEGQALV